MINCTPYSPHFPFTLCHISVLVFLEQFVLLRMFSLNQNHPAGYPEKVKESVAELSHQELRIFSCTGHF